MITCSAAAQTTQHGFSFARSSLSQRRLQYRAVWHAPILSSSPLPLQPLKTPNGAVTLQGERPTTVKGGGANEQREWIGRRMRHRLALAAAQRQPHSVDGAPRAADLSADRPPRARAVSPAAAHSPGREADSRPRDATVPPGPTRRARYTPPPVPAPDFLRCRSCSAPLTEVFADLGLSPLANSYLRHEDLQKPEAFYPLATYVCHRCWLVQLPEAASPEAIFGDYAYFSSYSESWLRHAADYVAMAIARFGLGADDRVVEIASNDGYLLRNFVARGVPALGIEPARNVAAVAEAAGVPTRVAFFGTATASELVAEGLAADLVVAQQRPRPHAGARRLRARARAGAETRRPRDPGVPASPSTGRRQPVRHDLPRALQLFLVNRRRRAVRRPRTDHFRCRGALDPRRFAAHLRATA